MDMEEAYFKDLLPEIGNQVLSTGSLDFSSDEISERLARYSAEEVEEILSYISDRDGIRHLEYGESGWRFLVFEENSWEEVESELEEEEDKPVQAPEIGERIKQLSAQEYGKLRNNIEEVYEGLTEVKDQRTSYFDSGDLKDKVKARAPEIGVVLSGLAAAGLIRKYRERNRYEPESIDTERIEQFKDVVEQVESFEKFKELVDRNSDRE